MNQTPKSATTAGLLGIFLGAVGAHCWYLGDKKKGIIHVSLFGAGILLIVIGSAILPSVFISSFNLAALSFIPVVSGIGSAICAGNGIWGLVEGIIILAKGDNGLAAMGIPVAAPYAAQPYAGQPYQQPYQQGYQQPYGYPQQPMQPMQGQPYPQQPMQPMQEPAGQPAQPENNGGEQNAAQ